MGYINKKIYKKKSPMAKWLKNVIIYGVIMLLCFLIGAWKIALLFLGLVVFSGYQLYRHWGEEGYSLADYIHGYDDEFPTENPDKKEKDERQKKYDDFVSKVNEELPDFEVEEDEDDTEDEDEDYE